MSSEAAAPVALEIWEGSKENIQPLKEGRKASSLARRFGDNEMLSQQAQKIKTERENHEAALVSAGADCLPAWIEYILETFTAGSKEDLITLLERCTSEITKNYLTLYKHDIRFLKVYLLYAEQCKDANDVYNVLEKLQIGASHGLLYEHWSQWLEDRGNHTGAMEILQLGIYRSVESERLGKLKAAVALRKAEYDQERRQLLEEAALLASDEPTQRSVLGGIASNHTRGMPVAAAPTQPKAAPQQLKKSGAPKIFIPCDNELASGVDPAKPIVTTTAVLPTTEKERHKENTVAPAKWSEVKLSAAAPSKPSAPTSSFAIFVDGANVTAPAPKKKTKKAAAPPASSRMI